MSAAERLADWHPARFIELVAKASEDFAWAAGVGGRETAGALISYLADHPEHIEPFINGGFSELPLDWIEGGRLTWHATDGKVVCPVAFRFRKRRNEQKACRDAALGIAEGDVPC